MKKLIRIFLLLGITTLLIAQPPGRDKDCTDIGCSGYSGCTASKWIHSSCTITCTDGDVLHCQHNGYVID